MAKDRKRKPFARLIWERRDTGSPEAAHLQTWSEFHPPGTQHDAEYQGRFILGDNLSVMQALLPEYEGQFALIYADPPFLTGKAYRARIGQGEDSRKPNEWETVESYHDRWKDGGEYLDMLYPRLELMRRLLSERGSLYLHLDWHASAYARVLLDELFGPDRLLNEIVWVYHGPSPIRSAFNRKHDTILVYSKTKNYTFNVDAIRTPYDPSTIKTFASSKRAGFGKTPDLERGKVPEDWWYFPVVARMHSERTGYPTQKPQALMERIVLASSNPGDLVGDFFSGSGTTPSIAARLERRWIACDPEATALQVSYRRLITTEGIGRFAVERTRSTPAMDSLKPQVRGSLRDSRVTVTLEGVLHRQSGKRVNDDLIVLWEIDTAFDGKIFRSGQQQVRPWRKGSLMTEMQCDQQERSQLKNIAVRVMDVEGNSGIAELSL